MKKFLGINRNKFTQLQASKQNNIKRKNRFKSFGKEQDLSDPLQCSMQAQNSNSMITTASQNSSNSQDFQTSKTLEIYEQAKDHLREAADYKKKIGLQCKLRITAFKESEAKKHDENICSLSKAAIQHILKAQKTLSVIRYMKGSNESEEKYYRNMEKSLAQELREMSKQLRIQQKQHFDRLKSYQRNSANTAIQLSQTQKQKMRSQDIFDEQTSMAMVQVQQSRDSQISELVKSINTLSTIYKQLNQLVIEQGSIIDRIDVNIEQTLTYVEKANQHLKGAQQKASSPFAEKCMIGLLAVILCLAVVLGFKYSK